MKHNINPILAVLTIITAMSLAFSCRKQEPEFIPNQPSEAVTAFIEASKAGERVVRFLNESGRYTLELYGNKTLSIGKDEVTDIRWIKNTYYGAEYNSVNFTLSDKSIVSFNCIPFEESLLIAAGGSVRLVNHVKGNNYTFNFDRPFRVDSLDTSFTEIDINKDYIVQLEDTDDECRMTFRDELNASFTYRNGELLEVQPAPEACGFPGETVVIPFSATAESKHYLSVGASGGEGVQAETVYDKETGNGEIRLTVSDDNLREGLATLTVTDGHTKEQSTVKVRPYYIDILSENVTATGDNGQVFTVEYDAFLPEGDEVIMTPRNGEWATAEGNRLTIIKENRTGDPRVVTADICDAEGRIRYKKAFSVTMETLEIATPEGMVRFNDWNFKKAARNRVDTDGDGEVSFAEAEAVTELNLIGQGIHDLTGLEAFKNVWKLNLMDNDVEDGTVIKELHLLYWLDLKGNKNLKTFDVTTCTQYFEHCEFEITDDLLYYTFRQQVGIVNVSDPDAKHSKHVKDERESTDWSMHNTLTKVRTHTKGEGYPIVFTGMGYIDVDMNDGSFDRQMNEAIRCAIKYLGPLNEHVEYFDFYVFRHIFQSREMHVTETKAWPGCYKIWEEDKLQDYNRNWEETIFLPYEYIFNDPTHSEHGLLVFSFDCVPRKTQYARWMQTIEKIKFTCYQTHNWINQKEQEDCYTAFNSETIEEHFKDLPIGPQAVKYLFEDYTFE